MSYYLGAKKPTTDVRDFKVKSVVREELPSTYTCKCVAQVKNQRNVNSCVAHATSTILETLNRCETGEYLRLSTDFIYGMQGVAFNRKDEGMYLRDACKIVKDYGDATDESVKGNTEQPLCSDNLEKLLNEDIKKEAYNFHVESYARCDSSKDIKHALVNYGPVLASIKWYDDYSFDNKIVHMNESSDFGYHAIVIYGYNEEGWLCQNSWGRSWNKNGKFILPYRSQVEEAWSFVDAENQDIYTPKRNLFLDIIYKLINLILNCLKK